MAKYFGRKRGQSGGAGDSRGDTDSSRSSGRSPGVPELPIDAGDLHRRIELYEFQLKNLRHELEQIKMQSILDGLRTPAGKTSPPEKKPDIEPEEFDEEFFSFTLYGAEHQHPADTPQELWAGREPDLFPATEETTGPTSLASPAPAQEYTLPPPNPVTFSLLSGYTQNLKRIEMQKALIFHLSSRLDKALGPLPGMDAGDTADPDAPEEIELTGYVGEPVDVMLKFSAAVVMIMKMEKEISVLRGRLAPVEELRETIRALEARNGMLREQLSGMQVDLQEHFNEKLHEAFDRAVARFMDDMKDKDRRIEELGRLALEYEKQLKSEKEKSRKLEKETEKLSGQINRLEARLALEDAPPPPPPEPAAPVAGYSARRFAAELDKLTEQVQDRPSLESMLRLRKLFHQSGRYDDGIRALLEILEKRDDRMLLPAVCVLVGEMYVASGRKQEAEYYLNNRLIEHDSLAQSLLRAIPYENIWDDIG